MAGAGDAKMNTVVMAGERTNYLSVALRARAAIKTLKSLMNESQGTLTLSSSEVQQDLESVVQSLKAIECSEPVQAKLSHQAPYRRFEELQTFDEVSKSFKDAQLLTGLEALLSGGGKPEHMRIAIRLFSAIEKRALYHYSDPSWAGSGV
jgi:hypothetical protein